MDHHMRISSLKTVDIFQNLDKQALLELSKIASFVTYHNNDVLIKQGEIPKTFNIVNKGLVKIIHVLNSGQQMILNVVTDGDSFGDVSIYDFSPYPSTAICDGEVTLITIDINRFFDFLDLHPRLYRNLLGAISQKCRFLARKIPEMALHKVESRIAKILLAFTKKMGYLIDGLYHLDIPLNRKEIAAMAGTTIETTVRVLGRLEKSDVIRLRKNHLILKDLIYLESLVDDIDKITPN